MQASGAPGLSAVAGDRGAVDRRRQGLVARDHRLLRDRPVGAKAPAPGRRRPRGIPSRDAGEYPIVTSVSSRWAAADSGVYNWLESSRRCELGSTGRGREGDQITGGHRRGALACDVVADHDLVLPGCLGSSGCQAEAGPIGVRRALLVGMRSPRATRSAGVGSSSGAWMDRGRIETRPITRARNTPSSSAQAGGASCGSTPQRGCDRLRMWRDLR